MGVLCFFAYLIGKGTECAHSTVGATLVYKF